MRFSYDYVKECILENYDKAKILCLTKNEIETGK